MKTILERLKIAFYALSCNIINRFSSPRHPKRVLIVFQQIFGDSIIFLPALEGYVDLYYKKKGYEITLLCLPSINNFLKHIAEIPEHLVIEIVDFKKLVNNYSYFKEVHSRYNNYAEIVIVPGASMSADLLTSSLNCKSRYALVSCYKISRPFIVAFFRRIAYTKSIAPSKDMMMIQRHRLMLNELGLNNYKGKLSSLKALNRRIEGRYCVICPGASVPVKMWPIERFSVITDYIIDKYNLDVHICGGPTENESAEKLLLLSKNKSRIHNHVGKTSFEEWSSLIQYAEIVIGNDSATLHIAAAARRKCICIAGVYDKYQFFPYKVDVLVDDDRLPVTVLKDMPCSYCRTKGYLYGYKNKECFSRVKEGKCALCIDAITVENVKSQIEQLLK